MKKRLEHSVIILQNGRKRVFFDQISSTNGVSGQCMSELNLTSGDVIYTNYQYDGQGQRGKSWASAPGVNVAMTYLFLPKHWLAKDVFSLNQRVALAVQSTVERFLPEKRVEIKWPNDIYVGDRKISGILIQNSLSGSYVQTSVIGVGINVAQVEFPIDLPNPTSMYLEGQSVQPIEVMEVLIEELDRFLSHEWQDAELRTSYHDALYRKGLISEFSIDGKRVVGEIQGVDQQGKLCVVMDGELRSFHFGEIVYEQSSSTDDRG